MCCDWRKMIVNLCSVFQCSVVTLSLACIFEEHSHGILVTYKTPPLFPVVHLAVDRLVLLVHTSQVAHQCQCLSRYCSMKRLDAMLVHRRFTPSVKFAGTRLYTWVERGTVRVKCLAQEHNAMSKGQGSNPDRSSWSRAH